MKHNLVLLIALMVVYPGRGFAAGVPEKPVIDLVPSRRDWGECLKTNNLPISSLLKDAVHQSDYGAQIINANIMAHLR